MLDVLVTDEDTATKVLNLLDAEGSEFLANTVNDTKDSRSTTQKSIQRESAGVAAAELALPETNFVLLKHSQHLLGGYGGDIAGYTAFECCDRVAEE